MERILGNLFTTPGATITILILIILKDVLERIEEDTVRKRTQPCQRVQQPHAGHAGEAHLIGMA